MRLLLSVLSKPVTCGWPTPSRRGLAVGAVEGAVRAPTVRANVGETTLSETVPIRIEAATHFQGAGGGCCWGRQLRRRRILRGGRTLKPSQYWGVWVVGAAGSTVVIGQAVGAPWD